jgi:hypothetical protein
VVTYPGTAIKIQTLNAQRKVSVGTNKDHIRGCISFVILKFIDIDFASAGLAESIILFHNTEEYENKEFIWIYYFAIQSGFHLTHLLLHKVPQSVYCT